jgi:uncharacterized membrane protein
MLIARSTAKVRAASNPSQAWAARTFLLLSLGFGLVFIFLTPPFQVPDEFAHFFRAYALSEGHAMAVVQDRRVGDELPQSLVTIAEPFFDVPFHPARRVPAAGMAQVLSVPLNPDDRVFVDFWNIALSPPLLHLPQATGIWIGRTLGLYPLGLLYAGRLVNLLVFTTLVFFALRLLPFTGLAVLLLATTPMSLFLAASLSHDATVIGSCFLWIAMVLRLAQGGSVLKPAHMVSLLVLVPVVGWTKLPYTASLLFLLPLIPGRRFRSRTARWLWIASIATVAGFMWLGWASVIRRYQFVYTGYNPFYWNTTTILYGANPTRQIRLILSDPGRSLMMFSRSLFVWENFRSFIGVLGWVDAPVPNGVIVGYMVAVLLALGLDVAPQTPLSVGQRALCLGAWLTSAFGMIIVLYISINPVGYPTVLGFQGRYLLPMAPLLALALYRGGLVTTRNTRSHAWIERGFVAWIAFSLLSTVWCLAFRYWVGAST